MTPAGGDPALAVSTPSGRSLDRSLARSIAWTGGVRWTSQALTWASTLIVARLLRPEDYGLVAMAAVFFGLVTLINEFGIGPSIVILQRLGRDEIAQLNGLAVLFGLTCFGGSVLLAPALARFYGAPEVREIVIAMSAAFAITGLRTVPYALLERELRFKALALTEAAQSIATAGVTVGLALSGYGYWALVVGSLAGAAVSTAASLGLRPHALAWPRAMGGALRISFHILVGRLSWYVYSNADFLVAGKVLGEAALGFYSFGFTLASIPITRISALVSRVSPAFFAAVQTETPALRRYFVTLSEGLALVTFPLTWGLALVAGDFVDVALGAKWHGAVLPLRVLACYAAFRCISPLLTQVLNVTGNTRFAMWIGLLSAAVLPAGFVVGSRYGTVGIAATWLVLHPLVTLPNFWLVLRTLELGPGAYLRSLLPALHASAWMVVLVVAIHFGVAEAWSAPARLAVEVAAGALGYAGALVLFHPRKLRATLEFLKLLRDE